MRKHIRLLALALVPLMVVACQKPNTSSEVSSSDSSIISSLEESTSSTTSESSVSSSTSSSSSSASSSISSSSSSASSSISSSSEIPSSSSSTSSSTSSQPHVMTPEEIELDEVYVAHYWDETIKSIAKRALGDSWNKVPDFIAPSYDACLKKEAKDGQEVLVMEVACYGVNPKSCTRLYMEKMEEYGFTVNSLDGYGYQMEDYCYDLFVSFEVVDENKDPYFLISAFIKKDREETWASEFVNLYTGMELPAFDAKCYTTNYDSQRDTLHIYAMFVDRQTAVTTYVNQLVKEGFVVKGTDNYGMTTLIDEDGYLTVQLYMTIGEYDCDALYIVLNNSWPNVYIASFIGATSFPKLESDTALYDGYAFVDSKGQGLDQDITLCLYYKQASSTDFGGYVNQLTRIGMTKGDMITYEDNDTYAVPMTYVGGGLSIKVNVMYRTSMNMICIVIYQAIEIK